MFQATNQIRLTEIDAAKRWDGMTDIGWKQDWFGVAGAWKSLIEYEWPTYRIQHKCGIVIGESHNQIVLQDITPCSLKLMKTKAAVAKRIVILAEWFWLVVSIPLKNMSQLSQLGWLFPIDGKIKSLPKHQRGMVFHDSPNLRSGEFGESPHYSSSIHEFTPTARSDCILHSCKVFSHLSRFFEAYHPVIKPGNYGNPLEIGVLNRNVTELRN